MAHEVQAEVAYQKEDGTWVHSDVEPHGCMFRDTAREKYRAYLHSVLDEWLDNSGGTGGFYIKAKDYELGS
jgi:hypothetical protein